MIEIIGWILAWMMVGLVTQLGIRVVFRQDIYAQPGKYFWSAILGFMVPIVFGLEPLINTDEYLNRFQDHE